MGKDRVKLGILFYFRSVWMGGIIYILNILKILDFLEDEDKPEVFLFYRPDLREFIDKIDYPYFKAIEWDFPNVYKGNLKSWLTRKNVFISKIIKQYTLDGIFPLQDYPVRTGSNVKLVSWIADLQHKYYPDFFSRRKIFERDARIKLILKNSDHLVVSSQTVADDFRKFYRLKSRMKMHVFHFVSVIDDFSSLNINEVRNKYKVPDNYFMVSNQFHMHKNHIVLLKALVKLKQKNPDIHLAITGRFPSASHSPYMEELHSLIDQHDLHSQISFLGVIPRDEQLLLMKYSQAVLQPSLFEGWSTVIEDAISLQVPVIAASLPVNIEQLGQKGIYFEPHDDARLAELLCDFPSRNLNDIFYESYDSRIKAAAKVFINIFRE